MGAKLRALYQRKKGRDLFDFWYALNTVKRFDFDEVVNVFSYYMQHGNFFGTRQEYLNNLDTKLNDKHFSQDILLDEKKLGKLIETLIYNEVAAQISYNEGYQLYHYRDRKKHEIDFLIENDYGNFLGIEVKSGSIVKKEHFKHLQWFKNNLIEDEQSFVGIVL